MPGDGDNRDPGIDTSEPKKIDAESSKFEGSSSADNITYPFGFGGAKSLRLSEMNSIYDYSSMPCIFGSPRFKSPDLSKHLASHSSWDHSNTDEFEVGSGSGSSSRHEISYSLSYRACDRMNSSWPDKETEMNQFDEYVSDWGVENQPEESNSESLGIDTSDILLLDSPNELMSLNDSVQHNADNSEYNHTQNERELPNLHCNSKRRCITFESTKSADIQPNPAKPADKQLNPAKPRFGSSSRCMVSGIGLHLNSLVPIPCSTVSQDSNNGLAVFMGQEEALVPIPSSAVHQEEAEERKISQSNCKKKRLRMENGEEIEGCKKCKCKKSKCLKLYCECFAAGVYCMNSCSCQECFNKPIHDEMVKENRKLILSRNPLAFEPRVTVPEIGKVDSSKTPASARHKSGCNCRKSSCLKKYCECYQGGVGCSIGCRCDGCKNPLGRKDGSQEEETIILDNARNETILFNNVEHNQDSELFPTPINDGSQEKETIMLDNAENETIFFSNVEHNQDSELFPTHIMDGSQEEEMIMLDNAENETIFFSDVENNQYSKFFPTPIKDGSQEEDGIIMFENAENETLLLNNLEHNQDSELFPTSIEVVRGEEKTQLPSSEIKRPPWLSNLSVIPESSYNAGKRVGKENMLPTQPMFEKQLETVQQEDELRVQFSHGNGIQTLSSSPNSKRVSSPYKAGGSSLSSSRSGRKKVLQYIS